NVASGDVVAMLSGHTGLITAVRVSADGSRIVTASDDRTARVWDVPTGREIAALVGHTLPVTALAVASVGNYVLTGSDDGSGRALEVYPNQFIGSLSATADRFVRAWFAGGGRVLALSDAGALVTFVATGAGGWAKLGAGLRLGVRDAARVSCAASGE